MTCAALLFEMKDDRSGLGVALIKTPLDETGGPRDDVAHADFIFAQSERHIEIYKFTIDKAPENLKQMLKK